MCYSPEQARRESALDLSNTLLIRKGVNSGRKAATREEVGRRMGSMLLSQAGQARVCARSE
jgi:hypothetical protein